MPKAFCFVLACCFSLSSHARTAVWIESPLAAEGELKKAFPNAVVVTQKECRISSQNIYSVAIISRSKNGKDLKSSLKAHMFYVHKGEKKILELKSYRDDSPMQEAIALFWNDQKKELEGFEILCAVPGSKDGVIVEGYAQGAFKDNPEYKTPHVCLQTDNMYSNYTCFNFNAKTQKIERSHIQEFAD